jgi:hypothetical protein
MIRIHEHTFILTRRNRGDDEDPARYKAIQDTMGQHLLKRWSLPRNGRRTPSRQGIIQ